MKIELPIIKESHIDIMESNMLSLSLSLSLSIIF